MSKIGRWFFSLLLCSLPAWAELEFFQFADKTTVGLEETFQLSVVVSDAPSNAQLELPSSNDFEILSRSQSTQLQYRTGSDFQKEQRYLFVLRAKKEGRLLIPSAFLKIGKNTYRTETVAVHVVRSQTANTPSLKGGPSQKAPLIPRSDSDLFIQMTLDKSSAYVGEQVLLSLQAYSRTANINIESLSMPTLKGFLSEDIELSWPLLTERKSVDGVSYYATTLKKRALFAIQSGSYTVEPATADFVVGQLFRVREVRRESNALTLEINALPHSAGNLPVGQWKLELKAPQGTFVVGQPVELVLTLQGTGNVKDLPPLELLFPNTFRTFQPTVQTNTQIVDNKLLGSRSMQYVAIPQEAGNFTVPAVKFDYFNAETAKVDSTQTSPLTLVVLPGAADPLPGNMLAPNTPPNPHLLEQEIHPVRHKAQLAPPPVPLVEKNIYWIFFALPLSLRLLGMLSRFALAQIRPSQKRQQRQQEKATILKIETLLNELKTNPSVTAFSQLGKNLAAFLELKLGFSPQGLTQEQLHSKMQEQGLPDVLCQQVLYILGECDAARFGNAPPHPQSTDWVCTTMLHVLKEWP